MLKAVFFDLDSTLLPMDEEKFMGIYLHSLYNYVKSLGFEENKFAKDIFTGVKIMMTNDGSRTNEEAFWSFFKAQYGEDIVNHIDLFESYYKTDFKLTKGACEPNELAKKIVSFVKENGLLCILSTNPLFPIVANETRLGFIGLATNDFDYITSYENSSYCKPNPKYFEALLNKFHLSASEVILFGNNVSEDFECASKVGIKCYLVGNHIIGDATNVPHISMDEVIDKIRENW